MTPGYLEFEQINITVKENVEKVQVTVVRLGGTDGILQLKYKTIDGTATMTLDYQFVTGDLVFKDGESKKTISVVILNDNVRESVETFQLQIYDISPGFGTINFRSLGTRLTTLITIIDDDGKNISDFLLFVCHFMQHKNLIYHNIDASTRSVLKLKILIIQRNF